MGRDRDRDSFNALGQHWPVAVAIAVVLVGGLALAWVPMGRSLRRRQSLVLACLVGALVFSTITGVGRWVLGSQAAAAPRYSYLVVAFILPALAVATSAIVRRWRWSTPLVVLLLLATVPSNVEQFGHQSPIPRYAQAGPQFVASLATSPLIDQVPPDHLVRTVQYPWLTTGWLARAGRFGWGPDVSVPPVLANQVPVVLGLAQSRPGQGPPATDTCRLVARLDRPGPPERVDLLGAP